MNGVEIINEERKRQVEEEGHNAANDASYVGNELAMAAICYAAVEIAKQEGADPMDLPADIWPWDMVHWKPSHDPIRNLAKAGALIAAEIDRQLAIQESLDVEAG